MKRFSSFTVSCVLFVISVLLLVMLLRERSDKISEVRSILSDVKKPVTEAERISYAYGVVAYRQLKEMGHPFSVDYFMAGLKTTAMGEESLMSDQEVDETIKEAELAMVERQGAKIEKTNKEKGEAFLAENGKKQGIEITASGLQYEVIRPGDGPKPKSADKVTVHYHGTLIDGTVFDSSVERGEPASFVLNQVISGWTEGVALMSKGAKYKFFIPYNLAYGPKAAGGTIQPYSTLIFEVELLDF